MYIYVCVCVCVCVCMRARARALMGDNIFHSHGKKTIHTMSILFITTDSIFTKLQRTWGEGKGKGHSCTGTEALCRPTAHRGSRGIALPFHDHGNRRKWGVSVTPRSLFTPWKTWYPLYRRLGGPQGRSGQVRKNSPPRDSIPGVSSP